MEQNAKRRTIDVIIPAYRPGEKFEKLLSMLSRQTYRPGKVIVINTEERYWDSALYAPYKKGLNLEVHHIRKSQFDHGGTRRQGVSYSRADVFVCLTDDAVPADTRLWSVFWKGLENGGQKVSFRLWYTPGSLRAKPVKRGSAAPGILIIRQRAW